MSEIIKDLVDLFLHIDKNLIAVVASYGGWSYLILFLIIFMETGLVVTPFLPGDSLIFAAGAISSMGSLSIYWLTALLIGAAFIGDTVNYWIGHFIGPKAFEGKNKLLKKEHLLKFAQSLKKGGSYGYHRL